jgi:PPP family 3-phenylpropionic acid transporter
MKNLSRQLTIKYAFLQSTYWISECVIYSFAAVFLHYKNFDNTHIGLVLSLSAILSILLQPIIAAFADKSKKITLRSIIILLMFIVLVAAIILYIMPNSFLLVSVVFVLINTIQYTLNPLFNSLAFEYMNAGIPMNYGLSRGSASVVFAITSYFLGISIDRFGAGILLKVFIISYVFLILSAYIFKVKKPPVALTNISADTQPLTNNAPAGLFEFFIKYKKYSFFLIGVSLLFYSHTLINTYLITIIENVGGNSTDLGIALTIAAALELPMMAAYIYLVRKISCNTLLIISSGFFIVKAAIMLIAPNVSIILLSMAFQMLSFALFTPASVYYVNSIIEEQDRIKGQSMLGVATWCISGTIASVTGGRILDLFGVSRLLLIATMVTTIGFIIICFTTQNTKEKA